MRSNSRTVTSTRNVSLSAGCLLVVLVAAGAAGCGGGQASASSTTARPGISARPATTSVGCRRHLPAPPSGTALTIRSGGRERTYELTVPKSYDGKVPYAVVFGLHPLTVSYQFMPSEVGFTAYQARYRFVGVAPSGLTEPTPFWDAAPTATNYDVTFISDLLTHLESTMCIDTSRVFSTGISNGAQLSSLLGCRMSSRITAIAPVEGEEYLPPCQSRPEPILAFHGTADPILPYRGGGLNATTIANLYLWHGAAPEGLPAPLGIDASMARWARHNGCNSQRPVTVRVTSDVERRSWRGCRAATVLYIVEGGGHGWPGKPVPSEEATFGPDTTSIDASNLIFRFFFGGRAT